MRSMIDSQRVMKIVGAHTSRSRQKAPKCNGIGTLLSQFEGRSKHAPNRRGSTKNTQERDNLEKINMKHAQNPIFGKP